MLMANLVKVDVNARIQAIEVWVDILGKGHVRIDELYVERSFQGGENKQASA